MKKIILGVLLCLPLMTSAQTNVFQKAFGGQGADNSYCIKQTSDKGFIIAGRTKSFGAGGSDMYLIKTNADGQLLWTKTYGGSGEDIAVSVLETQDGDYMIIGYTKSIGSNYNDYYIVKTTNSGDTLWTKTYGGQFDDRPASILEKPNGNFIIAGQVNDSTNFYDCSFLEIDKNSNIILSKVIYHPNYDDNCSDLTRNPDNSYMMTGGSMLVKLDSNLNIIWTKIFPVSVIAITPLQNGNFIIAGSAYINLDIKPSIMKCDYNGNILWSKIMNRSMEGYDIEVPEDGGCVILTYDYNGFIGPNGQMYLTKLSDTGTFIWSKVYNTGKTGDHGTSLEKLDDGYIIAGNSTFINSPFFDIFIIKTDKNGNSCIDSNIVYSVTDNNIQANNLFLSASNFVFNVSVPSMIVGSGGMDTMICSDIITRVNEPLSNKSGITIYPNPVSDKLNITYQNNEAAIVDVAIIDMAGRMIRNLKNPTSQNSVIEINVSNLNTGVYFISLTNDKGVNERFKFVKQ